ncbi:MAG: autotransporter domain-containing protein [Paracoccaceae bacterium]
MRLLAGSAAVMCGVLGHARGAQAQCVGGPSWVCSGGLTTTQTLNDSGAVSVTTTPGFSIDTTSTPGQAFVIQSGSSLTFDDPNGSDIAGDLDGLDARNSGTGALSVAATGRISSDRSNGVFALNANTAATGDVTLSVADVTGSSNGIAVQNRGEGALSVTASGDVVGSRGSGITASTSNFDATGDVIVKANNVSGGPGGISVRNLGLGAVSVQASGDVASSNGEGVFVEHLNTSTTSDLIVELADVSGGAWGVFARTFGLGGLSVTATGDVAGGNRDGISARIRRPVAVGDLTIDVAAVSGGDDGINARNDGMGAVGITTGGEVEGVGRDGIRARANGAIDIDLGGDVTGGDNGLVVFSTVDGAAPVEITLGAGHEISGGTGWAVFEGGLGDLASTQPNPGSRETSIRIEGTVTGGALGAVSLGEADDTVTLTEAASVAGLVDAGDDDDTLALDFATRAGFDVTPIGTQFVSFEAFESRGLPELTGTAAAADVPAWTVRSGDTRLSGAMGGTDFTVDPGATLSGTGTAGGLSIAGTLAPGAGGIGTLTATGDVTFATGSTFAVELADDGSTADLLAAMGAVRIEDGATLSAKLIGTPAALPDGGVFPVIRADGGRSGRFDAITDDIVDVTLIADYRGDGLDLRYEIDTTPVDPEPAPEPAPGPVDEGTGAPAPVAPVAPAPRVSPKFVTPATAVASISAARAVTDAVRAGASGGALQSCPPALLDAPSDPSDRPEGCAPGIGGPGERVLAFGGVIDARTRIDASGARAGVAFDGTGAFVGAEYRTALPQGELRAGLSFAGLSGDVGTTGGRAEIDQRAVTGHVAYEDGPLRAFGALSFGRFDAETTRAVAPGVTARGDVQGDTRSLAAEVSYDVAERLGAPEGVELRPYAGLEIVRTARDAFTETGAGFLNLSYDAQEDTTRFARIGVEYAVTEEVADLTVRTAARLGYERVSGDSAIDAVARLGNLPGAFTDGVAGFEEDRATVGLSIEAGTDAVTGFLRGETVLGRDGGHSLSAGVSYRF